MRTAGRLALVWLFCVPTGYSLNIQNVSGPETSEQSEIRRYDIHEADEVVIWGNCDTIEPVCRPDTPSFRARRSLPLKAYLTYLAELFEIDPRYLINDDKAEANFDNAVKTLRQVIDSESTDSKEKASAQEKFDNLTGKGKIKDRFTQARAIKRSLKWDPENPEAHDVSFEKSQVQFRQSAWPMNFVAEKETKNPLQVFEPSSEFTWLFAGNNLTFAEANKACSDKGKGFRLASVNELKAAQKWLQVSAIGAALTATSDGSKKVWTEMLTRDNFKAIFRYCSMQGNNAYEGTESVEAGEFIGKSSNDDIKSGLGARTSKASAVCVTFQTIEE